ncbi:hypothetical protein B0T25DRAFT_531618 [Lasiosphaeria hispida]|uniref:Uncharacterized protein n=1 Tax=Lasiosphaeria hispida TaxID=260671 RepID=A0AAJ0MHB2_9PEZI|nr:hypothetical protein B0T25DRAFT_531618 [Lasiosphaeria hispida]
MTQPAKKIKLEDSSRPRKIFKADKSVSFGPDRVKDKKFHEDYIDKVDKQWEAEWKSGLAELGMLDVHPNLLKKYHDIGLAHNRKILDARAEWTASIPPKPVEEKSNFDLISSLSTCTELLAECCKHLPPKDIVKMYSISRDFHRAVDMHMQSCVLSWSRVMAPTAARIFSSHAYLKFFIRDPAGRWRDKTAHSMSYLTHPEKERPPIVDKEVRLVPGLRWLLMVVSREIQVRDIIATMARMGHRLPPGTHMTLKKLWLIMDIASSAIRVKIMENRSFIKNKDLYNAQVFIVKLLMLSNDPVYGPQSSMLMKLFLGQRTGLSPLWALLRRKKYQTPDEILELKIRYDVGPTPEQVSSGASVRDVPIEEMGIEHFEGWGRGRDHLMRVDELLPLEACRRQLDLDTIVCDMMMHGHVDAKTGASLVPTLEEMYMSDDECPPWSDQEPLRNPKIHSGCGNVPFERNMWLPKHARKARWPMLAKDEVKMLMDEEWREMNKDWSFEKTSEEYWAAVEKLGTMLRGLSTNPESNITAPATIEVFLVGLVKPPGEEEDIDDFDDFDVDMRPYSNKPLPPPAQHSSHQDYQWQPYPGPQYFGHGSWDLPLSHHPNDDPYRQVHQRQHVSMNLHPYQALPSIRPPPGVLNPHQAVHQIRPSPGIPNPYQSAPQQPLPQSYPTSHGPAFQQPSSFGYHASTSYSQQHHPNTQPDYHALAFRQTRGPHLNPQPGPTGPAGKPLQRPPLASLVPHGAAPWQPRHIDSQPHGQSFQGQLPGNMNSHGAAFQNQQLNTYLGRPGTAFPHPPRLNDALPPVSRPNPSGGNLLGSMTYQNQHLQRRVPHQMSQQPSQQPSLAHMSSASRSLVIASRQHAQQQGSAQTMGLPIPVFQQPTVQHPVTRGQQLLPPLSIIPNLTRDEPPDSGPSSSIESQSQYCTPASHDSVDNQVADNQVGENQDVESQLSNEPESHGLGNQQSGDHWLNDHQSRGSDDARSLRDSEISVDHYICYSAGSNENNTGSGSELSDGDGHEDEEEQDDDGVDEGLDDSELDNRDGEGDDAYEEDESAEHDLCENIPSGEDVSTQGRRSLDPKQVSYQTSCQPPPFENIDDYLISQADEEYDDEEMEYDWDLWLEEHPPPDDGRPMPEERKKKKKVEEKAGKGGGEDGSDGIQAGAAWKEEGEDEDDERVAMLRNYYKHW